MPKVAFLMLDDIHHIHHLLPIALELSKRKEYKCKVFMQAHSLTIAKKIAALYPQHRCRFRVLSTSLLTRMKYRLRHKHLHSSRVIQCHVKKLLRYDILISPDSDMDQLINKAKKTDKQRLFFCTLHGAGDRPIDFFTDMKDMALALFPGEKDKHRSITAGAIEANKCKVIGYPKFDVIPINNKPRLFADNKPVVIYNPHFVLDLSSWEQWGIKILEYFFQQNDYNFIFAPHTNLFNRIINPRTFPKKYFNAPHFIIDFGSERGVDMTYTQAADIYLGDVSGQIYEFVRVPRPCLFLNPHAVEWRDNPRYRYWEMGTVINQLPDLWAHLRDHPLPNPYADIQKKFFAETFSITDMPAGLRAANAIHERAQR